MTARILSPVELHDRLVAAGHPLDTAGGASFATVVQSSPETIVTIASNLDPTLMPAYRGNYFACLLKIGRGPDAGPLAMTPPDSPARGRFRRIDEGRTSGYGFLDGPFRWLLRRLIGSGEILLWPEDRTAGTAPGPVPGTGRARSSSTSDETRAVAPCGRSPSVSRTEFRNAFVSDPACTEVARLHHHDKIVLSIPDEARRRAVLGELRDCESLEDCSNYLASWDDEDVHTWD